jgi:hypothetical protein
MGGEQLGLVIHAEHQAAMSEASIMPSSHRAKKRRRVPRDDQQNGKSVTSTPLWCIFVQLRMSLNRKRACG